MPSVYASPTPIRASGPLATIGRSALGMVGYLGGMGLMTAGAARALVRPGKDAAPLAGALAGQWTWLFGAGLPILALVHVSLGSFLAMQAYFGATFAEGAGPVVGVGLFRHIAPLMVGFVMAALAAGRLVPELRRPTLKGLDDATGWVPDREVVLGLIPDPRPEPEPARLVAVRLLAAAVAGPVLCVIGGSIGTVTGLLLSRALLRLSTETFMGRFYEMFWLRDAISLPLKGATFGLIGALFACHEGLRGGPADGPDAVPWAAARAVGLSALVILVLNSAWFLMVYMAGPAFGPTVLPTPNS